MTKQERDELIARHESRRAEYVAARTSRALSYQEAEQLKKAFEDVSRIYYDGLPRVTLSRCPFCDQLFRHSFDPWGPDGFWWQEGSAGHTWEPEPCPHFGVLQGALHLNANPPRGLERVAAYIGPEVPFVIPRVLEQSPVVAVVSELPMLNGYTAYPIVYFTRQPLPPGSFTQSWTRATYNWADGRAGYGWRADTDPWDFEIAPWVARGKLFWIQPGDAEMRIRSRADGPCPYIALPGRRERQYIQGDRLWTTPPPSGEAIDPFTE
jgi:hypothetical protein